MFHKLEKLQGLIYYVCSIKSLIIFLKKFVLTFEIILLIQHYLYYGTEPFFINK
jgi:hypothetical protein